MKATGIVRQVDSLGRIVIPKELRKTLKMGEGDPIEIFTNEDTVVLKKYNPLPKYIKEVENLQCSFIAQFGKDITIRFSADEDLEVRPKGLVDDGSNNTYERDIIMDTDKVVVDIWVKEPTSEEKVALEFIRNCIYRMYLTSKIK